MTPRSRLFPCLRYRNPKAAIDFLVSAFGFSIHAVHEAPDGSIAHAEIRLGDGIVMIGALDAEAVAAGRTVSGGVASIYACIPYVDGHHDKAAAAGAVIIRPPEDTAYGSREYSCRDLEGYEWHFGSYDPLAEEEA
jgi:uncharacterized glyoxalase superfamily protein PhnB